jgi:hypothetical protein
MVNYFYFFCVVNKNQAQPASIPEKSYLFYFRAISLLPRGNAPFGSYTICMVKIIWVLRVRKIVES